MKYNVVTFLIFYTLLFSTTLSSTEIEPKQPLEVMVFDHPKNFRVECISIQNIPGVPEGYVKCRVKNDDKAI